MAHMIIGDFFPVGFGCPQPTFIIPFISAKMAKPTYSKNRSSGKSRYGKKKTTGRVARKSNTLSSVKVKALVLSSTIEDLLYLTRNKRLHFNR